MPIMRRLCAWCRKDLDTDEQLSDEEYIIASKEATHGICAECEKRAFGLQEKAYENG